jgi:excisionase family DNA binding protein
MVLYIVPLCIIGLPMDKRSDTSMTSSTDKGSLMAAVPEGELFTLKEVAAWMKITVEMVRAMIKRGELPAVRVGRLLRIRHEDLDAFLARQQTRPSMPPGPPLC